MSIRSHELLFLITLLNLLLGARCIRTTTPLLSPKGMLMEDKIRLGSMPPTCHNRCNNCNPCTAVQVPTLPGQGNQLTRAKSSEEMMKFRLGTYSNYKPLGWKCQCGNQLFNP